MKTMTMGEAQATGRRFRYAGPHHEAGHFAQTGHLWRMGRPADPPDGPGRRQQLGFRPDCLTQCAHCSQPVSLRRDMPDIWTVERTEDEFEADALGIIHGLGLRVKETVQ